VKALNEVAREMDKQVIAEWVETPEALKVLLEMRAQFGQGYLFQRPMPLGTAESGIITGASAA
jgi:EAL domain-containing protein (putative c-di-GMP-specific phosphodiesterase class I)